MSTSIPRLCMFAGPIGKPPGVPSILMEISADELKEYGGVWAHSQLLIGRIQNLL